MSGTIIIGLLLLLLVGVSFTDAGWILLRPRREKQPGATQPIKSHESTADELSSKTSDGSTNNKCPFSKAFSRYRIDLTPVSEPPTETTITNRMFLGNLQKSWARNKIEQEFGRTKNVRWLEDQNGVEVLASLWRCAADLVVAGQASSLPDEDDDDDDESSIILAFPNAKPRVVRQWIDILEWMVQNCKPHQDDHGSETPILKAEYLDEDIGVPCLRLKRRGAITPSPSHQNDEDPAVIEKRTQSWVKRILVDLQICPFTKSTKMSGQGLADVGVPVGRIAYHTSLARKTNLVQLMADTWEAIRDMLAAGPSGKGGISSILMAAPDFDDDFDLWAGPVFSMLEAGVIAASAERKVGVVCFHPKYVTPDGSTFPGFGHMHSLPRLQKWLLEDDPNCPLSTEEVAAGGAWQRRTPHATINVLRADQLAAAEGRRMTGTLYSENIRKLVSVAGLQKLQADLDRERSIR